MSWVEAAAAARILPGEDALGGRGRTSDRLPQGPPPENYPGKWTLPAGWKDNGGPISELRFGLVSPAQAMRDDRWNLRWLLPLDHERLRPHEFENILLQDLRWELIIHHVCGRMGDDHLRSYTPSGELPTIKEIIERLIRAGFKASALADGSQSYLEAWALDVLWTEVHVWAGLQQKETKLLPVPNDTYARSANSLAAASGVELWTWTHQFCNAVTRDDKIGNIIETYAIWLLKEARWEDMATLVHHLAKSDDALGAYLAMTMDAMTMVSLDSSEDDLDSDAMALDLSADEAARAGAAAAARGAEPAREPPRRGPICGHAVNNLMESCHCCQQYCDAKDAAACETDAQIPEAPEPAAAACASGGPDVRVRVPPKPPGDVGLAYYYPGDHASASTARRKEQRIRQFDRWLSNGRPAADRPKVRDPRLKPGEHHPTFEDDPTYAYVAPEAAASDQRPAAAAARGRSRSQDVRAHMGRPSSAWPSSRLWQ